MTHIKHSVIDNGTRFWSEQFPSLEELLIYRRANMKTTRMLWLRTRASVDAFGELSNPATVALIHLN